LILETVKEAGWLYEWYRRLGFKTIGKIRRSTAMKNAREIDILLMIKIF
jgi:hypothetical protein